MVQSSRRGGTDVMSWNCFSDAATQHEQDMSFITPHFSSSSDPGFVWCGTPPESRCTKGDELADEPNPVNASQDSQAHSQGTGQDQAGVLKTDVHWPSAELQRGRLLELSSLHDPMPVDECSPVANGLVRVKNPSPTQPVRPSFIPSTSVHLNIKEAFREVQSATKEAGAFRDWFHAFANILALLGSRACGNPKDFQHTLPRYQKLLKAELIRGQVQATYAREDSDRLGRSRSPLVREGYGRAVRTGLWLVAAAVRTEQIRVLLGDGSGILDNFEIFPVSRAFEHQGLKLDVIRNLESLDLAETEMVYIKPLGVQLIKRSRVDLSTIEIDFGRRGLRASPSECAEICAASMMQKIAAGDVRGALKLLDAAFHGDSAVAVKVGLSKIDLQPNTLIAPEGIDPLTNSTIQQLEELKEAYEGCIKHGIEQLPFYLEQNIQVVENLIGDISEFCKPGMPAMVCGDLTEAFLDVAQLLKAVSRKSMSLFDPLDASRDMDRLYQAMQLIHHVIRFQNDWAGRAPDFEESIASLVLGRVGEPSGDLTIEDADALRGCMVAVRAPHAMALLEQVRASLPKQISIACLANGYYETPTLFNNPKQCDTVTHPDLLWQDLIVMEPHPNNAAKLHVDPHHPVDLIDHLFAGDPDHFRTLVIDITLNHLTERQVAQTIMAARPHIESGRLNLVLMQSATKFMQNGMDLASMGVALNFSKGAYWNEFRASMDHHQMYVPTDDLGYIGSLLSQKNKAASSAYLNRVRDNTATLRAFLMTKFASITRNRMLSKFVSIPTPRLSISA